MAKQAEWVGKILENPEEKQKKKGLSANLQENCKFCPKIWGGGGGQNHIVAPPLWNWGGPPCSAAYDLNYDPAGGCDGNHSHFSSLIVLFPITYKP